MGKVNEKPNTHYVKVDVERTPDLIKCLAALKIGQGKPPGVNEDGAHARTRLQNPRPSPRCPHHTHSHKSCPDCTSCCRLSTQIHICIHTPCLLLLSVWARASHDMEQAGARTEGVHYRILTDSEGQESCIALDLQGQIPKVKLTSPWLKALNYKLCGIEPAAESHFACVCTPYVFNRYQGIFGLTGSVGGKAELGYLQKTYHAVKFNVPRFLDTCVGTPLKVVTNHGVELCAGPGEQIARVVELCEQYFRRVPVLVIAASDEELGELYRAVGVSAKIPQDEVLRLSEFDEHGISLKTEWQTIIDDSTKRLGTADDNRCRVTITDRFGGRGHDFQVGD